MRSRSSRCSTSTYDAEYGRSAGAQVNVVLKSGGERLSGSATSTSGTGARVARRLRSRRTEPEPFRRRHQFGGTFGGPAPLLRGFFFAAVEGVDDRTADTRLAHVPTAAERARRFQRQCRARSSIRSRASRFPATAFPPSRIDPTGAGSPPLSAAEPRGRGGQLRVVAAGPARRLAGDARKPTTTLVAFAIFLRATRFAHDDRDDPFADPTAASPASARRLLDIGHNLAFGLAQSFSSASITTCASAGTAWQRDVYPDQPRHRRLRRRSA